MSKLVYSELEEIDVEDCVTIQEGLILYKYIYDEISFKSILTEFEVKIVWENYGCKVKTKNINDLIFLSENDILENYSTN